MRDVITSCRVDLASVFVFFNYGSRYWHGSIVIIKTCDFNTLFHNFYSLESPKLIGLDTTIQ